ncbi:actin interacting protein 3-domain-containing protein [Lipomyces arxii]|uniref:actin interacting protein 3-domain-containing protein n=1 Tax=Lipomyces arxii TaxID=56418 RepID=UPI0034CEA1E8
MNQSRPPLTTSSSASSMSSQLSSTTPRSSSRQAMTNGSISVSGSQRSGSGSTRRQNAISTIESSVSKLLTAAKQLLDCLALWAEGSRSEFDVSDVYVTLGQEFNITSRAFRSIGMEVSDLGDVPTDLREILEATLSRERSQAGLDMYLPAVRDIILKMLQGLKEKQAAMKRMVSSQSTMPTFAPPQQQNNKDRSPVRRSNTSSASPTKADFSVLSRAASVASTNSGRDRYVLAETYADSPSIYQPQRAPISTSNSKVNSSAPEYFDAPLPAPQPYHPGPTGSHDYLHSSARDPLAALQRGEGPERRASRRISAYQISKYGIASTEYHTRSRGNSLSNGGDPSKLRQSSNHDSGQTVKEEVELVTVPESKSDLGESNEPTDVVEVKVDSNSLAEPKVVLVDESSPVNQVRSVVEPEPKPVDPEIAIFLEHGKQIKKLVLKKSEISIAAIRLLFIERLSYSPGPENFADLTIKDVKTEIRYELDESTIGDVKDGSLVSLKVPDVAQKSLEDSMTALLNRFEELQTSLGSQNEVISKINEAQDTSASKLQQITTLVEKVLATPPPPSPPPTAQLRSPSVRSPLIGTPSLNSGGFRSTSFERKAVVQAHLAELAALRKELAALRQVYGLVVKDVDESLAQVKTKVEAANTKTQTSIVVSGNVVVQKYHDLLSKDTDELLTKVEDLQDVIEGLRKDVALRGVRPLPRELDGTTKDLESALNELARMQAYVKKEKPTWKKILEKELDNVVEEQQFFTLQEDLLLDLQEDLKNSGETFDLLRQFTEEQSKNPKSRVHTPAFAGNAAPEDAKDAVLAEVRALNPNHESRVEAIERAERLRQKANESRVDEFERELEEFVGEGKLKKSGGIEEVERVRKQREDQMWKEYGEIQAELGRNRKR